MTRTRLLLVSPSFGSYGGVQAVMFAIAASLPPERFDVRICFKLVPGSEIAASFTDAIRLSGVPTTFVPPRSRELVRALRWADVVHCHTPSLDVVMAARGLGKPVAVTVYNNRRGEWLREAKEATAMLLASERWFISDFVLRSWGLRPGRFGVRKVPTVSVLPVGACPPQQRRGFLFIGRWIENKGLEETVRAYARLGAEAESWPLILIGEGPLSTRVERLVESLGLDGAVQRRGYLVAAERDAALRAAKWLVVPPNTREDLGLTAIEARAVGVPCIATRDGGLPEAAGVHALYSEPGDVDGLTRSMRRAMTMDDAEYERRSADTTAELRAWLRPIGEHAGFYEELLRG